MFRSFRIGTIAGFPIEVNLSFLLMLGVVLIWLGGLTGITIALIAFGSVLLHELGHALMARRLGVDVAGIELHFFGGAAKMVGQPKRANDEIAIAAAGPAVSFALGAFGLLLGALTGWGFLAYIGWINVVIGAFNLIPALPMDGGRILRALLTRKYDFGRATEISIIIARGFAIALAVYGLASLQIFLLLLAVVLWFMGTAELRMARLMSNHFSYDRQGYRHSGDVEVIPEGAWAQAAPGAGAYGAPDYGNIQPFGPQIRFQRPVISGGFVIRRHNGRLIIKILD